MGIHPGTQTWLLGNASSLSLSLTIKREFICTCIQCIHILVWWLPIALFGGQEGVRIQQTFTISKMQWTMNMKLREKRNQVMMPQSYKTYIHIHDISIHLGIVTHYLMFVYLLSVRFWKVFCDIQDLRSSTFLVWYLPWQVLNQHFCSPSSLPQTWGDEKAATPTSTVHISCHFPFPALSRIQSPRTLSWPSSRLRLLPSICTLAERSRPDVADPRCFAGD